MLGPLRRVSAARLRRVTALSARHLVAEQGELALGALPGFGSGEFGRLIERNLASQVGYSRQLLRNRNTMALNARPAETRVRQTFPLWNSEWREG